MEGSPEDVGGSPDTLFQLSARAVTADMERLEEDVWGLPVVVLQGLLPMLNIYYLERIEPTAVRKGLSTQSVWCELWKDVMKSKPSRLATVICWRKKFLEAFFHNVLRGVLDVSCDRRLHDHRFSPLVHSACHVSELTICNKQQEVAELTPALRQSLAQSVEALKFLHLRQSDPDTQKCLRLLLHHLIHHGHVHKVSVLSWPCPDNQLLALILTMSAGYWQPDPDCPCSDCPPLGALLSLQPLNISHSVPASSTSPGVHASQPTDLYDFIFSVSAVKDGAPEASCVGASPISGAVLFRSVRALNLHNIPLTLHSCRSLCRLLRSWTSLERLTMAYNDLGANIALVLEALSALSRSPGCCLRVFSLSDITTHVPMLELVHTLLRNLPNLHLLSLSYDLESHSEWESPGVGAAHCADNGLQQLELRFPHDPVRVEHLVPVLKASPSLVELSLDNATFSDPDDLRRILRMIADGNVLLRRLGFHDMKMSDAPCEILHLLSLSRLEEIRFSFCRLFENSSADFVAQFVAAVRSNPSVRILTLNGNRLGNDGLCALAELYSSDTFSGIIYLDVSSNCIKPDGLLRFSKKLEGRGKLALRQLDISQNLLDRDPVLAREALQALESVCQVVRDSWDSSQAFSDHVGVM